MKAFIFQAALICEDCGNAYMARNVNPAHVDMDDESSYDSGEWPKGPYDRGGGEADSPQHCDHCGIFLENPLTHDGVLYVEEKAAEFQTESDMSWSEVADAARQSGQPVLAEWIEYYFAPGM